jgi:hypothetical protein
VLSSFADLPEDFSALDLVYVGDPLHPVEGPGPGPVEPVPIPEPSATFVLAAGLIGLAVRSHRRRYPAGRRTGRPEDS